MQMSANEYGLCEIAYDPASGVGPLVLSLQQMRRRLIMLGASLVARKALL